MTSSSPATNVSNLTVANLLDQLLIYRKQISHRVILVEFGKNAINLAVASSGPKSNINFKKFSAIEIPEEAIDKSIPTDPSVMGDLLKEILQEQKILSLRTSIVLSPDAVYTRLINIPSDLSISQAYEYVSDPSSGVQIPISLSKTDFDITPTSLPELIIDNNKFRKYFLLSIPKKTTETILQALEPAGLDICSLDVSFISQLRLITQHIASLSENEYALLLELNSDCSHVVIADSSGPVLVDRIASIKEYPQLNRNPNAGNPNDNLASKKEEVPKKKYMKISKLDLRVIVRELKSLLRRFTQDQNITAKFSIYLSGHNSQHDEIAKVLGESINLPVYLVDSYIPKKQSIYKPSLKELSSSKLDRQTKYNDLNSLFSSDLSKSKSSNKLDINLPKQPTSFIDNPIKQGDTLTSKTKDSTQPDITSKTQGKDSNLDSSSSSSFIDTPQSTNLTRDTKADLDDSVDLESVVDNRTKDSNLDSSSSSSFIDTPQSTNLTRDTKADLDDSVDLESVVDNRTRDSKVTRSSDETNTDLLVNNHSEELPSADTDSNLELRKDQTLFEENKNIEHTNLEKINSSVKNVQDSHTSTMLNNTQNTNQIDSEFKMDGSFLGLTDSDIQEDDKVLENNTQSSKTIETPEQEIDSFKGDFQMDTSFLDIEKPTED